MRVSYTLALGALLATAAYAQPPEVQKGAIGNISTTDGYIQIINDGRNAVFGDYGPTSVYGWLTAEVYVFDASDEQLVACCSCSLSADAAATISAKNMLANNPLTGKPPTSVTVTLVTINGGPPGTIPVAPGPGTTTTQFGTGLHATRTMTHLAANYPTVTGNFVTEAALAPVTWANNNEYANIVAECNFILHDGSGNGVCGGCNGGASSAVSVHTK